MSLFFHNPLFFSKEFSCKITWNLNGWFFRIKIRFYEENIPASAGTDCRENVFFFLLSLCACPVALGRVHLQPWSLLNIFSWLREFLKLNRFVLSRLSQNEQKIKLQYNCKSHKNKNKIVLHFLRNLLSRPRQTLIVNGSTSSSKLSNVSAKMTSWSLLAIEFSSSFFTFSPTPIATSRTPSFLIRLAALSRDNAPLLGVCSPSVSRKAIFCTSYRESARGLNRS